MASRVYYTRSGGLYEICPIETGGVAPVRSAIHWRSPNRLGDALVGGAMAAANSFFSRDIIKAGVEYGSEVIRVFYFDPSSNLREVCLSPFR